MFTGGLFHRRANCSSGLTFLGPQSYCLQTSQFDCNAYVLHCRSTLYLSAALGWDGWAPVGVPALAMNSLARISCFSSTYRWQNWPSPGQTNGWYLWGLVREFLPKHLSCRWVWTYLEVTPMRYNFFWILPLFSVSSTEKQVRYNIKWLYRK